MFCLFFHNFDVPLRWMLTRVVRPASTREDEAPPSVPYERPVRDPRFKVDWT